MTEHIYVRIVNNDGPYPHDNINPALAELQEDEGATVLEVLPIVHEGAIVCWQITFRLNVNDTPD